jgi:hypothetical protein
MKLQTRYQDQLDALDLVGFEALCMAILFYADRLSVDAAITEVVKEFSFS